MQPLHWLYSKSIHIAIHITHYLYYISWIFCNFARLLFRAAECSVPLSLSMPLTSSLSMERVDSEFRWSRLIFTALPWSVAKWLHQQSKKRGYEWWKHESTQSVPRTHLDCTLVSAVWCEKVILRANSQPCWNRPKLAVSIMFDRLYLEAHGQLHCGWM